MGVLTDYFRANAADLASITGSLPASWPRVDAKGFGTVPCETLGKRIGVEALEPGEPPVHGDDYEWFVQVLTEDMVAALAGFSGADVANHGAYMAKTQELGWPESEGVRLLNELTDLAKQALANNQRLYMWTSL